jgi:hypothetical protein
MKISNLSLVGIVLLVALAFVGVSSALVFSENPCGDSCGKVHTVTGGGQLVNLAGKDNWKAFTARIDKDGNVKGQIQNQGGNAGTWHGDVTNLIVENNKAIIEFYITFAPDTPSNIGKVFCIIVIDNGEGMDAAPDQISSTLQYDASYCVNPIFPVTMMDLIGGNIQVR